MILNIIVAVCDCNQRLGIGLNNGLPWGKLKEDMKFFKKITTETNNDGVRNAVIMGRVTWDSIPVKPLQDRANVIISHSASGFTTAAHDTHVVSSLESALSILTDDYRIKNGLPIIENIFIIGGASIYEMAFNYINEHKCNCNLYMTKIMNDMECDTFFPDIDYNQYYKTIPSDINFYKGKNKIKYYFQVYKKI